MINRKNISIMELAYQVLTENKKAMTFIELYDIVCKEKGITEEDKLKNISQVYSDFVTSAKFIYVGEDEWDIKGRQAIDLWDKDGAYYDEYPDYEEELSLFTEKDTDEYSLDVDTDEEEGKEEENVYEEDFDGDDDSEYDAFVEEDEEEDYIEDVKDLSFEDEEDPDLEEESELEDEEKEEFDDEEYNEYMDDYEEMYDD